MTCPRPEALLQVTDLVVRYGGIQALHGVHLSVESGEIVSLIGANGAGKSTLLRALSGLIPTFGGQMSYASAAGKILPLHQTPAHQIVAAGLSQVPEGRGIFGAMSVKENLDLGAYLRHDQAQVRSDREQVLTLFPRIRERLSQLAGTLSGGEQQMLAIARALMSRPRLLLLDEPSLGLAPLWVEQIFQLIRTIHQQGTSILLVEQNAHMALQAAQRVYVLETGRMVLEGPSDKIRDNDQVRRAYLGEDL